MGKKKLDQRGRNPEPQQPDKSLDAELDTWSVEHIDNEFLSLSIKEKKYCLSALVTARR